MASLPDSLFKATENFRPTHALVHRSALQFNLDAIRREIPATTQILAMVKADAYGHGALQISKWLAEMGVAAFGVVMIEEGIALRTAGITRPILIMGGLSGEGERAARACIAHHLTPVLHTAEAVRDLNAVASAPVRAHLKLDTGMGRLGVRPEALPELLATWKKSPHVTLGGLMTHFANASDPQSLSEQLHVWDKCVKEVRAQLGPIPWVHVANSASVWRHVSVQLESGETALVRPGVSLYGGAWTDEDLVQFPLRTVMEVKSKIVLVKHAPKGTPLSYMGVYHMPKDGRYAVVPIGYSDGYPWAAQGKAEVLVRGRRLKVAGRITMDMIMVDISDHPDITTGDEVVMIGSQGNDAISATDVAEWGGTISYEIMCRVGPRVPRIYVE